jgi:hypothetical protein
MPACADKGSEVLASERRGDPRYAVGLLIATFMIGNFCFADENSKDMLDVKAVCTRCHTADAFMTTPRSWQRWNAVFARMMEHGATGSDAQFAGVTEFFLLNLTIINANTSPPDELEWVLNASPATVQSIVERRQHQKFSSLSELSSVPNIDKDRLNQIKDRILF